jgi:hypothetical protein
VVASRHWKRALAPRSSVVQRASVFMRLASTCQFASLIAACVAVATACLPDPISLLGDQVGTGEMPSGGAGGNGGARGDLGMGSSGIAGASAMAGQGGSGPATDPPQGGAFGFGGNDAHDPFDNAFDDGDGGAPPEGPRCLMGEESVRCPAGFHCVDQSMTCVVGCYVEAHCRGVGVCDFPRSECVECVKWTDCLATLGTAGMVCDDNKCRPCDERHSCPLDLECAVGRCDLEGLSGPPGPGGSGSQPDASTDEPDQP